MSEAFCENTTKEVGVVGEGGCLVGVQLDRPANPETVAKKGLK